MADVQFVLNGCQVEVAEPDRHATLLQYLRTAGHTGTKEGCAEGECGACAVVLRHESEGDTTARYVAVNSCLLLLPMVAGREVLTVEGIAGTEGSGGERKTLHPVQAVLAAGGGSQCGYCTPGFVMTLFAEYYRPPGADADPEVLSGNLCRCTGYRPIREAARSLGRPGPQDPFRRRLEQPEAPAGPTTAAAAGSLLRPGSLPELLADLHTHPAARLVAGGTDLALAMGHQPAPGPAPLLISLEQVPELRVLGRHGDELEIGAGLTLTEIEQRLRGHLPILDELLPLFASRLIRNRATLGGNLATASPIGDAAPVLLALGSSLRLAAPGGERLVPLDQFFTGYRRTVLARGEVIVAVRIPLPAPAVARFYKVARRARDDISAVAAAFALDRNRDGRVTLVRLAYGGVAATPVRARQAEAALQGRFWDLAAVRAAQAALDQELRPISDHRASAAYRRALVAALLEKFYWDSVESGPQRLSRPHHGGEASVD